MNLLNITNSISNHLSSSYNVLSNRFVNIPEKKNLQNLSPAIKEILDEGVRHFENEEKMINAEPINSSNYFIQDNSVFNKVYLPDSLILSEGSFNWGNNIENWNTMWCCGFGKNTETITEIHNEPNFVIYLCNKDFITYAKENNNHETIFDIIFDNFLIDECNYNYLVFAVQYINSTFANIKFWGSNDKINFTYIPLLNIYESAAAATYFTDLGLRSYCFFEEEYSFKKAEIFTQESSLYNREQCEYIPGLGEFILLENQPDLRLVYNNQELIGLYQYFNEPDTLQGLQKTSQFNSITFADNFIISNFNDGAYVYMNEETGEALQIMGQPSDENENYPYIIMISIGIADTVNGGMGIVGNKNIIMYAAQDSNYNFQRISLSEYINGEVSDGYTDYIEKTYNFNGILTEYTGENSNRFSFQSWMSLAMLVMQEGRKGLDFANTTLDAESKYVWEQTFYTNNGVYTGTLHNLTPSTLDQLNIQQDLYYSLNTLSTIETNLSHLFDGYNGITLPIVLHNATDVSYMYANCNNLQYLPLSYYDYEGVFDNVTNMENMFLNCSAMHNRDTVGSLLYLLPNYYNLINATNNLNYLGLNEQQIINLNISKYDYVSAYNNGWNVPVTFYNYNLTYNTTDNSTLTTVYLNELNEGLDISNNGYVINSYLRWTIGRQSLVYINVDGTNHIQSYYNMFAGFYNLQTIILNNTSNALHMNYMFEDCYNLRNISNFDTSNVTNMRRMFSYCNNLTTIPNFNTINVINMGYMFAGCRNLINNIPNFNTNNVTDMESMFSGCYNLIEIPNFYTNNVTYMNFMFQYCYNLIEVPNFNTSNVTTMSGMLKGCYKLTMVPQFDTSNVISMTAMFSECNNLTEIPNFNTSNVTNMSYMFQYCPNLIEVPNFDTSNVTNMSWMFYNCLNLTTIPNFNTNKVTNMAFMFNNCYNLSSNSYANIANSLPLAINLTNQYISNIGLNISNFTIEQIRILNSKGYLDAIYIEGAATAYDIYYTLVEEVES